MPLLIYSVVYFAIVILVSLYPGKLLDTVGNFLAPLKIIALVIPVRRGYRLACRSNQQRPGRLSECGLF
ncbi:branched-chain amino acid ABC transporter [Salmonella enterica subsp. enterica serovar Daytona]|uniref:Branched-chain amino acid transport system carrier protein n=1 Tax=Salmonella enterica subsp. enterica serovar Daytona TaxID=1962639 RepID=A0A447JMC1_SALET|nr:branched-chain amino acid ABC transporter [Salmonella enterica subsp. enterica serovar Daytona]